MAECSHKARKDRTDSEGNCICLFCHRKIFWKSSENRYVTLVRGQQMVTEHGKFTWTGSVWKRSRGT